MISVITPCKNIIQDGRETFFRKMIDSLYGQTYQDFEHIVIDSASVDGTLEMLKEFKNEGKIDTLVSEPDKNVNDAMNKGFRLARGEIIHIMNSDNYFIDSEFFKISLKALYDHGADFTHADRRIENRKGEFIAIKYGNERSAFFRMPFRHQTMLIKREVYDEVGPFDDTYEIAADYKFMLKMLILGKKGFYIPKMFVCSLDEGITSDRTKVIEEVARALYESYGQKYRLTEDDCRDIYLRRISESLFAKIKKNIKDEAIKKSLEYCYELSIKENI